MSLFVSYFINQIRPFPTDVLFEWPLLDNNCILSKNELAIKVTSSHLGEGFILQLFISCKKPNNVQTDFKKLVRSKQNKIIFTDGDVSTNILGMLISEFWGNSNVLNVKHEI